MEAFVYCWTDHKTSKLYVGYHKGHPNDGYICSSKHMLNEYMKRPKDFTRQIISSGSVIDMISLETAILKSAKAAKSDHFYNLHENNGVYNANGHSDETKLKMSKSKTGKKRSKKSCEKQSKSVSGKNNHFFGKTHTNETKKRMSDIKKKAQMGENNTNAKKVKHCGVIYGTIKQMSMVTGISLYNIRKMIKNGNVEVISNG